MEKVTRLNQYQDQLRQEGHYLDRMIAQAKQKEAASHSDAAKHNEIADIKRKQNEDWKKDYPYDPEKELLSTLINEHGFIPDQ